MISEGGLGEDWSREPIIVIICGTMEVIYTVKFDDAGNEGRTAKVVVELVFRYQIVTTLKV